MCMNEHISAKRAVESKPSPFHRWSHLILKFAVKKRLGKTLMPKNFCNSAFNSSFFAKKPFLRVSAKSRPSIEIEKKRKWYQLSSSDLRDAAEFPWILIFLINLLSQSFHPCLTSGYFSCYDSPNPEPFLQPCTIAFNGVIWKKNTDTVFQPPKVSWFSEGQRLAPGLVSRMEGVSPCVPET